jgi:hypothetical protein
MAMLMASIVLEAAAAVLAVLGALKGGPHLNGFAFAFAVYGLYDFARLLQRNLEDGVLSLPARARKHALRG